MKKMTITLTILLILLGGCAKKPVITGQVGSPINLKPEIKKMEDTIACSFKWSFDAKPAESIMDVLSFMPDSRSFEVSFVPDVPGDYQLQFASQTSEGKEKFKQIFQCVVTPDTTPSEAAQTGAYPTPAKDLSAPPPQYAKPGTLSAPPVDYVAKPLVSPKLRPKVAVRGRKIPKVDGKYTIQISAWANYNQAEAALAKLTTRNLDAYIQKAYFQETRETWYRVRTGTFDSFSEARQVMKDLKGRFPQEDFWIDFVREDQ